MKKQKILLLFHCPYFKPRGYDFKEEFSDPENMYTENDVAAALKSAGHELRPLGLYNDLSILLEEIKEFPPDVIFNMVEVFHDRTRWEKNIAGFIDVLGFPYTGASADALFICSDKALSKKILKYHRIKVPDFQTFYRDQPILSPTLRFPCVVKPLCEEASRGISQASIVDDQKALIERVQFIHEQMKTDAIAEEYVEGREFYVTVFGNKKLEVWPPRELIFGQLPEDGQIATYKAKWDNDYRKKWGIKSVFPNHLSPAHERKIISTCRRAYRALNLNSYARFDVRLSSDGEVYIIEPNANPCLARVDEVAQSALKAGISYEELMQKILNLAFQRKN